MNKIPLAKPYVGDEEIAAVTEVIKSGMLSLGPKLKEFETNFAQLVGTKHAIAVNSGTSGLHLCLKAIGIKPGDEVITASFSFVASSNPIIFEGATPIFVDIDEKTYNMDPEKLKQAITEKTKAIIPVHMFGQPCNMDAIMEIANEKNIPVIEDACEALEATWDGKKAGTFGNSAVVAFYPNKQMTTGEGGIILTDDDNVAELCKSYRNQGRDESGQWLNHIRIGYNYRLDEMSCAMGVEQLKKVDFIINKRKEIAAKYTKKLEGIEGIILPYVDPKADSTWFVYSLRTAEGINRNKMVEYLNENGVGSKAYFYPPIHLQPIYKEMFGSNEGDFPVTEKISNTAFILPFFTELTDEQINTVCSVVEEAVRKCKND